MKKPIVFLMALFLLAASIAAFSADLETLVQERTVVICPEGQVLGNMVIGARGKMEFIYVDKTLAHAIREGDMPSDWLSWYSRHWGTEDVKGRILFIIRYEANKPWSFDPGDISIGGRSLERKDILTDKAFIVEGDLPSGTLGILSVAVPSEFASPGKATVVSYLEDSVEWTVPAK
ncbi:MAG: hypothetical protein PHQ51_02690 [Synergistales bacterium]|nr:hypothetical protein [Synergistales bacterium]